MVTPDPPTDAGAAQVNGAAQVTAAAKLTLSLRITGVRDDGFHLIDAEMVTLDLADSLHIDPSGAGLVVVRDGIEEPGDSDDLVLRALDFVGMRAGVRLHKEIPAGAGLGGGSADAAAVLRWAGWADPASSVALGADVPFCVVGGRARVTGVGEDVVPLEPRPMELTLLTPPVHCSTPGVYRMWDELGGPVGENGNDLEPAALAVAPELVQWRDALAEATGQVPRLAGSGSTWWVEGAFPGRGRRVAKTVSGSGDGP